MLRRIIHIYVLGKHSKVDPTPACDFCCYLSNACKLWHEILHPVRQYRLSVVYLQKTYRTLLF